jgi:cardiolipin synthase
MEVNIRTQRRTRQRSIPPPPAARRQDDESIETGSAAPATDVDEYLVPGNRVEVLCDGKQTLPAMFTAIRAARRWVYLEYYVFEELRCGGEALSELLVGIRAAGVEVAIIYDAVGSQHTSSKFLETLEGAGIHLLPFDPVNPGKARGGWSPNRRDHRKLLIVDGRLAIVGGVNLSAHYEIASPAPRAGREADPRRWRDTDLLLKGPVIAQLQRLFLNHWTEQNGPILPNVVSRPEPRAPGRERVGIIASEPSCGRPRYYDALLSALRAARSRVWITAGYFLPTPEQKYALIEAAQRGVDVQLLLAAHNDSAAALAVQRSGYAELLRGGIRIHEREGVILHSKSVIVDACWSAVGSSNFDQRSVRFNDEVDVVVIGTRTADALGRVFLADIQSARVIEAEMWRRRPWHQRALELFWNPWKGLL